MLNKNSNVKFKYLATMPIQEKKIKDFIEDLQVKHYNDVLNGKMEVWISPFVKEKTSNFFQLVLDIDVKKSSSSKIYSYFLVLKSLNAFKKYFTILYSGNGYHITSNFFVDFKDNSDMEVKEFLKNKLKKNIPGLDLIIIRDNPVRRIGYRKDIDKWCSPAEDKLLPPDSKRLPTLKEIDLKDFIEDKLLPWNKVVSVLEFKRILDVSQLGG